MKSLKKLILKRKREVKMTLSDKDVFFIFSRIAKEEFGNIGAEKLKGDYFKNGTLFVRAASGAWGGELFSNRTKIIRKINRELGSEEVREIKMK